MARSVVLIDDEPDLVDMLKAALHQRDYDVHTAGNGRDGLELIENLKPDAVICDLMMPGVSGLEVCKKMRSTPELQGIPLLVISALGAESDKPEEFWAAGLKSDDFISKPFDPSELLGRLEYVLRRGQYVSAKGGNGQAKASPSKNGEAGNGSALTEAQRPSLTDASPKAVVRHFIESWNTQDFETEYLCMDKALHGGLPKSEYIGRRRHVFSQESKRQRRQELSKIIDQRRTAEESTLVVERKDTIGKREDVSVEEYNLKKTPEGWRITSVRKG